MDSQEQLDYRKNFVIPFLRRVCKTLDNPKDLEIMIARMKKVQGTCFGEEIIIDYRKEILSTLLHELMHYFYPWWSEYTTLYNERRTMRVINKKEIKKVLYKFLDVI